MMRHISIMPEYIQNLIGEYNCHHRQQMKNVFQEMRWRRVFDDVVKILPGRIFCIGCRSHCDDSYEGRQRKPIICTNVDFCSSTCNRFYNDTYEYHNDRYEYNYDMYDENGDFVGENYEFTSTEFQYPGWGKLPGRPGQLKKFSLTLHETTYKRTLPWESGRHINVSTSM